MKTCITCNQIKPYTEFAKRKDSKDGHLGRCKDCIRSYRNDYRSGNLDKARAASRASYWKYRDKHIENCKLYYQAHKEEKSYWSWKAVLRKRNLTEEDYQLLIESQDGRCAICKRPERAKNSRGQVIRLAIDHCHETNEVRGLLCRDCNTALGKFQESAEILKQAIKYLER